MNDLNLARPSVPIANSNEREITIAELFSILWRSKWRLLAVAIITAAAAYGISRFLPVKYDAVIVVAPVSSQSSASKLSDVASSFGGLSGLLGFSSSGNEQKAEYIATLQSEALTTSFIKEQNLLPVLYPKQWVSQTNSWNTSNPKKVPTLWKANRLFATSVRGITENAKTGLVTMTISWKDPVQAAAWANGLVKLTNDYLRDKAIARSERNIQYLSSQAAKANAIELRTAIFELLQNEIKTEMVSRGNDEYALKVIDPAAVPEKQASPQPFLLSLSAALGALAVYALVIVARR